MIVARSRFRIRLKKIRRKGDLEFVQECVRPLRIAGVSPSPCRNHGAVHGLGVKGAGSSVQGAGCRKKGAGQGLALDSQTA